MPRVVVDVMLKPEILDPEGKAIGQALPRMGFTGITDVRAGKHFVLDVADSVTDEALREIADRLLANPVIENFTIRTESAVPAAASPVAGTKQLAGGPELAGAGAELTGSPAGSADGSAAPVQNLP